ncbi:MAG: hypothetical protein Q9191_004310 [Dirinaria sp. TL-2023a]
MGEPHNISQILAALGGTPSQGQQQPPQQQPFQGYPAPYANATPPVGGQAYAMPQPTNSGSIDLSNIKPVSSGSVSLSDAVARARGIAAEKGIPYDSRDRNGAPNRDSDPRLAGRMYRRSRSRSRSPPRHGRDSYRDNYNPYRDERRDDPRRGGYVRDRSFSPTIRGAPSYSPRPYGRDRTPPGRRGEDDNSETINIASNLVGLIIGRQGENLRRVEGETATRVQFVTGPEANGPMRSCKITGTRKARDDAKAEIQRIIDENGNAAGRAMMQERPVIQQKGPGSHQPALRAGEDATQIMVPNRTVGLIIGRGGETIRDLQERSQCHVNIVGEEKSVNGLRPVNLIGTAQAAAKAKDLIMEIVESDTKSLASQGGSRDQGRGQQFGGLGGDGEKINDQIVVPSEAVGMIIGKGGETIKDMQTQTGCKINVSPASGRDIEREIGLVGSRVAIDAAKRAILEKVHAVEDKNRSSRGGGGGGYGDPQYNDRYQDNQAQQQSYGQPQNAQAQAQAQTPSQSNAQGPPGGEDMYAAYGGYNNYIALWMSHWAAQGQQPGGQTPSGEQGPSGS